MTAKGRARFVDATRGLHFFVNIVCYVLSMKNDPPWRQKRREKIISAASALFARASYDIVQMDDIARRADLGKPTLYRYFASKEELYLSVCDEAFQRLDARLDQAGAAASPAEALRQMVGALIEILDEQLSPLGFLHGEDSALTSQWQQLYRRRRKMIIDRLRSVLAQGVARGDFAALNTAVAPNLLLGAIRGGLVDSSQVPKDKLAETISGFVLRGLAPPSRNSTDLTPAFVESLPARARR